MITKLGIQTLVETPCASKGGSAPKQLWRPVMTSEDLGKIKWF